MTGPEHYQAAEHAIAQAASAAGEPAAQQRFLALAQIHATLASTAVTALVAINGTSDHGGSRFFLVPHEDRKSWEAAVTQV